ncbi:hypothetical protein COV49_03735 [Candidatus Falkowbacteria bacterium CG11_big_fil_rev_8_21_14_0_20_39_10]|uniref:Uncharacterized protein n=1 Tax=Candidatus Falkowbacteria bacterium CG11_big_fil_rev_8_21_14_0_20_39_10 TaxID=1974570 RepID=A0A2M6K891_9BACT|nr:MAG: hypothetical protein COV49_03735 [Candidatus Falkowbacteria bacterium CG11_big_fil_rev_8_21_14_0_20_39_10]
MKVRIYVLNMSIEQSGLNLFQFAPDKTANTGGVTGFIIPNPLGVEVLPIDDRSLGGVPPLHDKEGELHVVSGKDIGVYPPSPTAPGQTR